MNTENTSKPSTDSDSPRIYVGTFAKYNAGSIRGAWIELEGHDAESFAEACRNLHSDEHDPEIMLQDFEGFPRDFYSESGLSETLWEWMECTEEEREVWEAYAEAVGYPIGETTLEQAQEAYAGEYDSQMHFAEAICVECELIPSALPSWIASCIDWQAVWDSALRFDYCEHNGKFFRH